MAEREGAKFFSETKERKIKSLLSNAIGIVARGKDGVVVHLKAKSVITGINISGPESQLCVLGISGLEAETRNFKVELTEFWDEFKLALSLRDFNLSVLRDFISEYLSDSLFSRTSEKPSALEFVLCEVNKQGLYLALIDFRGEFQSIDKEDQFALIGCTNKKKRGQIARALTKLKPENLSVKELSIALESLTKDLEGESATMELSFVVATNEAKTDTAAERPKLTLPL